MFQNLITSVLAFASTNIDDIFILMLFYGHRNASSGKIIAGQYLGIGALLVASFIGAYIGDFFAPRYVRFLGLFPMFLAGKQLFELFDQRTDHTSSGSAARSSGLFAIAGVTIANGADNIGVYVPLLTTMNRTEKFQLIAVFALMIYGWCRAAQYLAAHPLIARRLDKYGHYIMPIVLFALGTYILLGNGAMD